MCTTVRRSRMTLNYQANESLTTLNYYLPVPRKVRDGYKVFLQWFRNETLYLYIPVRESPISLSTLASTMKLNYHVCATAHLSEGTLYICTPRIYEFKRRKYDFSGQCQTIRIQSFANHTSSNHISGTHRSKKKRCWRDTCIHSYHAEPKLVRSRFGDASAA